MMVQARVLVAGLQHEGCDLMWKDWLCIAFSWKGQISRVPNSDNVHDRWKWCDLMDATRQILRSSFTEQHLSCLSSFNHNVPTKRLRCSSKRIPVLILLRID